MKIFQILATLLLTAALYAAGSDQRPNIVLILADDHGWHEVEYYGHPHLKTPELAAMSREGMRFDRFYAAHPVCSPTRASIMTGRHPNRMSTLAPNHSIRPEEWTLSEELKRAGYDTAHFGKWHLGPVRAGSPTNPGVNGFDTWISHDNFFGYNALLSRDGAPPERLVGESSEELVADAIRYLEKRKGSAAPFFTYICFGSPHEPYSGIDDDIIPYKDLDKRLRHRFAEIVALDRSVGRLRDYLRESGQAENTIVWYMSDNGAPQEGAVWSELRGHKGQLFEGGIRVPSIVEWPAKIRPGKTDAAVVTSDVMPTILDWLGLSLPDRPIDGISVAGVIAGKVDARSSPIGFWRYVRSAEDKANGTDWLDPKDQTGTTPTSKVYNIQFNNFRPPLARTEDFGGTAAWMSGRYKLYVPPKGKPELYDLVADISESKDLAASKPELVAKFVNELHHWQRSVERSYAGLDF